MNAYISVDELKLQGNMDILKSATDLQLLRFLVANSRKVDRFCNRFFFMLEQAKKLDGDGSHILLLPDLISIDANGLTTDDDRDRVFETTWATSDFLLLPSNADPDTRLNPESEPFGEIQADLSAGTKASFPPGYQTVQIDGEWGWWKHVRLASEQVSGSWTTTDESLAIDARADIEQGMTILVGTEQIYVKSYEGNNLNVIRGVNGSVAATASDNDPISIFEYPSEVVEATMIMMRRQYANAQGNYANVQGFPDGSIQTFGGMSRDAAGYLQDFVRYVI